MVRGMPRRFDGDEGRRRLKDALGGQRLVGGDDALAAALAAVAVAGSRSSGGVLISQADTSNCIYFILSGHVTVLVNGRGVATRGPGDHVGEMALVDPAASRSATVTAIDDVLFAEVPEAEFTRIAADYPAIWRRIGMELCHRLRQRGEALRQPNETPRLFLGSSAEALSIVRALQDGLSHDPVVSVIWTDRIFGASSFAIESLEAQVQSADFAAMVFSPDDTTLSRAVEREAPRDNVVFELGLFMGVLGRRRTFIVKPRGVDLKIPSDLLGLGVLEYPAGSPDDLASRVGPVCNALRTTIARLRAR